MKCLFITGTDTGVGKTYHSTRILQQLNQNGYRTIGLKPLASGCELNAAGEWVNDDALALQAAASVTLPYADVNPIALQEAIAPHIAAAQQGISLSADGVVSHIQRSMQQAADIYLIEGVGGWQVPLNDHETMADVVKRLDCAVILVVVMRLGCLNHALLTWQAIQQSGVAVAGWVANVMEPDMPALEENIATLTQWISAPLLAGGVVDLEYFR